LVNDIYQDSFGFIWVTTEYGLNRFDGLKFATYRHENQNTASMTDNYTHVVFEDKEKHLWIGGLSGLMRYHHDTDTFEHIALLRGGKRVVGNVMHITETKDGKIWIATSGQGMFVMGNSDTEAQSIENEYPKANPSYQASLVTDGQHIWVGTESEGVFMLDVTNRSAMSVEDAAFRGNSVQALALADDGTLFVGTQINGLLRYDAAAKRMVAVPYRGENPNPCVSCLLNFNGQLLVGSDGAGIKVYNPEKDCLEDYVNSHVPVDLTHSKVHALMGDREGNLWVGLFQKGVARIPQKTDAFTYYGPKSALGNPLGDACIMAICHTSNGHLWVGADNDGLYELDPEGNRLNHYKGNSQRYAPNTVLSLFEDSQHTLWVGSYNQGITRLSGGQFTLLADSLKDAVVFSIAEGKGKKLYIALFGGGFIQYDLVSHTAHTFHSTKSAKDDQTRDELPNDWVNALYADREGLIWIGHYKGVSCFNPENETFLTINRRNSLTVGCVGYTFTEDIYGNVWAGTSDGLYRYNKKTGQTTHFTEADGLANDVVCGLGHDDQGNIWATTYNGMSKYESKVNRFINYYVGDGLQGNDFTHGACFTDAEGTLFFGGPGGVTAIQPNLIAQNAAPSKVYITDFYVHNQPVYMNTLSGDKPVVDAPVPEATHFRLAYVDNTFSLALSTMTFDHPEQITYEYKMDEMDGDWTMTEPGANRVTYHNLSPGNYTFRVRAVDHGVESEETVIPIHIDAPWYFSWWALCIYGAFALFVLWIVVMNLIGRVRNQRNQLKAAHAEQLSEAKMQFFVNISHEIRTPMTLIISPLEKFLKQSVAPETHQTYLIMYRNAQRILNLINQLLDIGKLDKGQMRLVFSETDLVGFIQNVMQPFEYQAKKKQIRFTFAHVGAHMKAWVDTNNFDKVLVNILSNAFKFTPEHGEIQVRLSKGHDEQREDVLSDYIEITVTDSGTGIAQDQLQRIFERFYQADNELGAGQFGTGVGLHLTHSLVKLHHGEIHAENREGGTGTRFVIRIPQGHAHLQPSELDKNAPAQNVLPKADVSGNEPPQDSAVTSSDEPLNAAEGSSSQTEAPAAEEGRPSPVRHRFSERASSASTSEDDTILSPAAQRAAAARAARAARAAKASALESGQGFSAPQGASVRGKTNFTPEESSSEETPNKRLTEETPNKKPAEVAPNKRPTDEASTKKPKKPSYEEEEEASVEDFSDISTGPVEEYEPSEVAAAPAPVSYSGHVPHLLVVEDEEDIRFYLQQELSDGYRVDVAANGKEAFDFVLKEHPDLIISDVMMPVMDGNTLCRKVKKHPQTNHIPVILLTAKAQPGDRMEGLQNGADAYMVKPFNVDVLRSHIANLIGNRRVLLNKFSGAQAQEDKVTPVKVRAVDDKFMERVMTIINNHMADPEFNVEALSTELGLSRVHVHRKLKEITNLSTSNFIKQVRLQEAARLLQEDDKLNVSEVAYAVGYVNLSHFSVAFHDMYGMSPKEYMRQGGAEGEKK
jgi:signal transduction histidine kinase/ligand-binding sensor domain-containing protein/DNA-binding response OmpR family regulator